MFMPRRTTVGCLAVGAPDLLSLLVNWGPCKGCPADFDGNGEVGFSDLLAVIAAWGNKGGPEDLDGSGFVDFGDILVVLAAWGACE